MIIFCHQPLFCFLITNGVASRCRSGVGTFIVSVGHQLGVCQPFWLDLQIFLARLVFQKFSKRGIPLLEYSLASFVVIISILSWFHCSDALDAHELHDNGRNFLESCEERLGGLFLIWNRNRVKRLWLFRQLVVVLQFFFKLDLDQLVVGCWHGILKLLPFLQHPQDGVFRSQNKSLADEQIFFFCKTKPACVNVISLAWKI